MRKLISLSVAGSALLTASGLLADDTAVALREGMALQQRVYTLTEDIAKADYAAFGKIIIVNPIYVHELCGWTFQIKIESQQNLKESSLNRLFYIDNSSGGYDESILQPGHNIFFTSLNLDNPRVVNFYSGRRDQCANAVPFGASFVTHTSLYIEEDINLDSNEQAIPLLLVPVTKMNAETALHVVGWINSDGEDVFPNLDQFREEHTYIQQNQFTYSGYYINLATFLQSRR